MTEPVSATSRPGVVGPGMLAVVAPLNVTNTYAGLVKEGLRVRSES